MYWVSQLPDVTNASHRFGGTEFEVDGMEFMHFHGPNYLDIRLSQEDQQRVLREEKAHVHRFAPQAGWVTVLIRSERDIPQAKEIIKLAYGNAKEIMETHAVRRTGKTSSSV
jgi:hypothetical protein